MNATKVEKRKKSSLTLTSQGALPPFETDIGFVHGLLGFEEIRTYRFAMNEDARPFLFMNGSQGRHQVSFICVDTFFLQPEYQLKIPRRIGEELDLRGPEEAAIVSIVTVGAGIEETTANLMSPIVINVRSRLAEQVVLDDCPYPVRFRVWDALRAREEKLVAAC